MNKKRESRQDLYPGEPSILRVALGMITYMIDRPYLDTNKIPHQASNSASPAAAIVGRI